MWKHIKGFVASLALWSLVAGDTFEHIGCYKDDPTGNFGRDLDKKEITYSSLELDSCTGECRKDGFPYAGIQEGDRCYCGLVYGQYSVYPPYKCNFTCSGGLSCGGVKANDVYYTVKTDAASVAKRERKVHTVFKTFTEARITCIQNGGDLALLTSASDLNHTVSPVKDDDSVTHIWFGLRRPLEQAPYEWTDASVPAFDRNAFTSWWKSDETWENWCIVLRKSDMKWESTSCNTKYPFVCMQNPAEDDDGDGDNTPDPNDEGGKGFDKTKLSLYIVLPLMMFCYGGSCIAYCSAKLWRNCRRDQRKKQLETMEFEPHNKPPPTQRPLSARRVAPMPVPTMPYTLPPPRREPPPPLRGPPPRPIRTPVQEMQPSTSRPTTTGAIELDVATTSPPPPYYDSKGKTKDKASQVKEEQRRRHLLNNALKEARGRREKEKTLLGGEMETSLDNKRPRKNKYEPDSSGTSPEPMENMEMDEDRPRRKRRNKKARPDDPDSGDSTTDLLADSREPPKAPIIMSIADIMKSKLMMNQGGRKKPKRIIQAA